MSQASKRYPVSVFWSDEDEGFVAIAPDLPGCSAFGETAEEALRELDPAMEAWLEATVKAGNPIPKPSTPPTDHQHSGKVLLRMPRELHTQLARAAAIQNVSLNQYLVYVLTSAVTKSSDNMQTSWSIAASN
jgi:predicted RNase H-like HicB family nuclease